MCQSCTSSFLLVISFESHTNLDNQIIEELYTRLSSDEIADVLSLVKDSLLAQPILSSHASAPSTRVAPNGLGTMEGDDDPYDEGDDLGDVDYVMNDEAGEDGGQELDEADS